MQDIVLIFNNEATRLNYSFIYGAKAFLAYDVSNTDLTDGHVLVALFPLIDSAIEIPQSNNITKIETSTTMWFGRKFDETVSSGTMAELDETNRQKYDRRLFELKQLAMAYIEAIICGTDIELRSFRMTEQINQTAENIDFISCDLILRHENIN